MDHSVQIDHYGSPDALKKNMEIEFKRNRERYEFLKWSAQAFKTFHIIPPGNGICHQVNLEYVSQRRVAARTSMFYPDSLVGIDSHTTMVNGLGVLGWGVGGIEAEASMLGQPMYFLEPDVVGVHLDGQARPKASPRPISCSPSSSCCARRKWSASSSSSSAKAPSSLTVPDRATIGNMSPEYGATCGFFPVDDASCEFLRMTGRGDIVPAVKAYYEAQGMFGMPKTGRARLQRRRRARSRLREARGLRPAPPARPSRAAGARRHASASSWAKPIADGGYGKADEMDKRVPTSKPGIDVGHGDVLISAITSCTNTSNPGVLLGAGLLAKKAVEKGLKPHPRVKTSLGAGLARGDRLSEERGAACPTSTSSAISSSGYGCTTCIGNSGPLDAKIEEAVNKNDLVAAAVLSGNRNFEARIHQAIRANFLMSPPLVVAFGLAGTVNIDMSKDPLGTGKDGKPVYLKDIWPSQQEIGAVMKYATDPEMYKKVFSAFKEGNPMWDEIPAAVGATYQWDEKSTYVRLPPYFDGFTMKPGKASDVKGARVLGIFGDSITTDHISPAGGIRATSPAGKYLQEHGVAIADFNTYGARRGNHEVMMRGTFANIRIKNLMLPGTEGGITIHHPSGEQTSIYEAAMRYKKEGVPTSSSAATNTARARRATGRRRGRSCWATKAVIVRNFERIHRANLVFMGVLPLQFKDGASAQSLKIDGSETIDLLGIANGIKPMQDVTMVIHRKNGQTDKVPLLLRIDTPIEVDYYQHGGILPYVLRELIAAA